MMASRILVPELLDELPPDDPRAIRSREDLRRINGLMRGPRTMARLLSNAQLGRILEIGAGDGHSMLEVARRLGGTVEATLLDQQAIVPEGLTRAFADRGWTLRTVQADAFDYLRGGIRFDAIVANLFLHHFEDDRLAELLSLASERCDVFVACEPRRSALGLVGCGMMPLVGFNDVTRHDARVDRKSVV